MNKISGVFATMCLGYVLVALGICAFTGRTLTGVALVATLGMISYGLFFFRHTSAGRTALASFSFPTKAKKVVPIHGKAPRAPVAGKPAAAKRASWLKLPNFKFWPAMMLVTSLISLIYMFQGKFLASLIFAIIAVVSGIFYFEKEKQVFGWLKSTAWPFLRKNWKLVWLAISVTGVIWELMFDGYPRLLYEFWISTILAAFTLWNGWSKSAKLMGEMLSGKYGLGATLGALALLAGSFWLIVRLLGLEPLYDLGGKALFVAICLAAFVPVTSIGRKINKKKV